MKIDKFPFTIVDWTNFEIMERDGVTGKASSKIFHMGPVRVRMVDYSANYLADHWCHKGHIIYCIEGEMETKLEDGRVFKFSKGMTYHVGDDCEAHRSSSVNGCKLLIVD
ncbi:DHCW motif cupin fold protein [Ferruginibacter profundus]